MDLQVYYAGADANLNPNPHPHPNPNPNPNPNQVDYAGVDGRVALVGDAAHAMTPSLGEGGNCALESAVALLASLPPADDDTPPSIDELSCAFTEYGRLRPAEVRPVQLRSTAASQGAQASKGARKLAASGTPTPSKQ